MSRLLTRIRKLEAQAGQREQQVHVIIWREQQETQEEAKARFLAECPGREIRDDDLVVFIREVEGCPELPRKGKFHCGAPTQLTGQGSVPRADPSAFS